MSILLNIWTIFPQVFKASLKEIKESRSLISFNTHLKAAKAIF